MRKYNISKIYNWREKKLTIPDDCDEIIVDPTYDYVDSLPCFWPQNITIEIGSDNYVFENGILFEKNTGTIIFCSDRSNKKMYFPEGTKIIGYGAFFWCEIYDLVFPDSVIEVRPCNFSRILERVEINSGCKTIDMEAFKCGHIKKLIISDTVDEILNLNNTKLLIDEIIVDNKNMIFGGNDSHSLLYRKDSNSIVFATKKCNAIPNFITEIEKNAFRNIGIKGEFILPKNITNIANRAFVKCRFDKLVIESNVKKINKITFDKCKFKSIVCECIKIDNILNDDIKNKILENVK